jgi:parallel beta helix pectate lyase-like protein
MRRFALSVLIALCLACLAAAVTHRDLSAAVVPFGAGTADLVVESAADAGPGTLRDAIMAADRLSSRARITISTPRIRIESALPALVNPHGIEIEAGEGRGVIDADHMPSGAVLKVMSPGSALHGISIVNAHDTALMVNVPAVKIETVNIAASKVGVLLGSGARGATIRACTFEHNGTAVTAEAGIEDLTILASIFRGNERAGFWFVGAPEAPPPDAPGAAPHPTAERARIVDAVFDANGTAVVLANRTTFIQKSRFLGNREFAVQVLAGSARIEDSEIRDSKGTALSVVSGNDVVIARNTLIDNISSAILVRDSGALIEHNRLVHNGFGIVSIISRDAPAIAIRDNFVQGSTADAVTLIGGAPLLAHNEVIDNHGAGVRVLDLAADNGGRKAAPQLVANVVRGNGIDRPQAAVYKVAGAL